MSSFNILLKKFKNFMNEEVHYYDMDQPLSKYLSFVKDLSKAGVKGSIGPSIFKIDGNIGPYSSISDPEGYEKLNIDKSKYKNIENYSLAKENIEQNLVVRKLPFAKKTMVNESGIYAETGGGYIINESGKDFYVYKKDFENKYEHISGDLYHLKSPETIKVMRVDENICVRGKIINPISLSSGAYDIYLNAKVGDYFTMNKDNKIVVIPESVFEQNYNMLDAPALRQNKI